MQFSVTVILLTGNRCCHKISKAVQWNNVMMPSVINKSTDSGKLYAILTTGFCKDSDSIFSLFHEGLTRSFTSWHIDLYHTWSLAKHKKTHHWKKQAKINTLLVDQFSIIQPKVSWSAILLLLFLITISYTMRARGFLTLEGLSTWVAGSHLTLIHEQENPWDPG